MNERQKTIVYLNNMGYSGKGMIEVVINELQKMLGNLQQAIQVQKLTEDSQLVELVQNKQYDYKTVITNIGPSPKTRAETIRHVRSQTNAPILIYSAVINDEFKEETKEIHHITYIDVLEERIPFSNLLAAVKEKLAI